MIVAATLSELTWMEFTADIKSRKKGVRDNAIAALLVAVKPTNWFVDNVAGDYLVLKSKTFFHTYDGTPGGKYYCEDPVVVELNVVTGEMRVECFTNMGAINVDMLLVSVISGYPNPMWKEAKNAEKQLGAYLKTAEHLSKPFCHQLPRTGINADNIPQGENV